MADVEVRQWRETPDVDGAYPRLSEPQMSELARHGHPRPTQAGEVLYRAGDVDCQLIVVLSGLVAVIDPHRPDEPLGVHGPGRFVGELSLLTGQAALLTAVVREPGEVLTVPLDGLKEVALKDAVLADLVLRALLIRRSLHIGLGAGLRILGSRFSPDSRRLRDFLARNRLPHRWIDLEEDRDAEAMLRQLGVAPHETPVVVWRGEQVLRNPSNAELAELLGLRHGSIERAVCDLLIVGAGPAGLAAAVYGATEGLNTVLLDSVATGGQAGTSSRIENYLGFPAGISGMELADRAVIQARRFGAQITVPTPVVALTSEDGRHLVSLDTGEQLAARAVLVATGVHYRRLDVPGTEQLAASIYYAATPVEAAMCRNDPVVIVGGGNSAGQAAVFLADHAQQVHLIVRNAVLDQDMSRYLANRIAGLSPIQVHLRTEVRELVGNQLMQAVIVENLDTGETSTLAARSLFVFIGSEPNVQWLGDALALDDNDFILTGQAAAARVSAEQGDPRLLLLETTRRGVFAAGDVRTGSVKRVAAAVGDGSLAVRLVHERLREG
ncbi:MAG: thioredoxin reductase [Nocardioidaceae bacterium]|nr:thioredoxin reductase [Nocardioidaceae bacterium]